MFGVVIITGEIDSFDESLIAGYQRRFDADVYIAGTVGRVPFPSETVDDSETGRAELADHLRGCDLVLCLRAPLWVTNIVKETGKPAIDISSERGARTSALADARRRDDDETSLLTARLEDREQKLAHASARIDSQEEIARSLRNELHQLAALRQHLAEAQAEARVYREQMELITSSNAWRIVRKLWRISGRIRNRRGTDRLPAQSAPETQAKGAPATDLKVENRLPAHDERAHSPLPTDVSARVADSRRVPIVAPAFFDLNGNNMHFGGAERYLIELSHLIRELGYEPEVYQPAIGSWVRYYSGLRVRGIDSGGDLQKLNAKFHSLVPEGALTIYLAFFLATPRFHARSIGISHGIYWDNDLSQKSGELNRQYQKDVLSAMVNVGRMVSVDSATMNWVRGVRVPLAKKFEYIPNFVDLEQFHPAPVPRREGDDSIVILFPRRFNEARGFWMLVDLVPEFLERYPNVKFDFVGKAIGREAEAMLDLIDRYKERVSWRFLPPERMHEAYQQADIALIPTVESEGTSLSCLEAMACGNAIVATTVGGLTDLILPDFNGLLIEPRIADLRDAITRLLEDEELRRRLGRRGRKVAQAFSITIWQERWKRVLAEFLPQQSSPLPATHRGVAVFPAISYITWEVVKQRPHHLAVQLAAHGIETYWRNPTGKQVSGRPGLHIVSPEDDLYLKSPFVLIYWPFHYLNLGEYDRPRVIFDVLDDISIHDASDRAANLPVGRRARDYYKLMLERADLVMTSSNVLFEKVRLERPDVMFIPNGVDLEHFNPERVAVSSELKAIEEPVVGFHGAIAEWVDYKLLEEVLDLRPQYQFVFVGPVSQPKDFARVLARRNARHIDTKVYELVPGYIAGFKVGIVPFLMNDVTRGVRPLKVLEYMAMGKPTVATPLPDITHWPGVLCATTAEMFAAKIDEALENGEALMSGRDVADFLCASSWKEVTRPLMAALDEMLGNSANEVAAKTLQVT